MSLLKNPELIIFSTTFYALHMYQKINSRLFPDLFPIKDNNFLFQTQGYQIGQWSIETLKNAGTKLFS